MGNPKETVGLKTSTKGLVIALVYGICSASMAFANKAVLSTYDFDYPLFLVTVQMVVTIVILESLRSLNMTGLVHYTLERGKVFFFPSLFYAINSVLSLSALSGMNIPMYGMLKRCGPLLVLVLGAVLLGKGMPSKQVCLAVAAITSGCILAGFGDLAFDLQSYLIGSLSVVSQALYLVLLQKCSQSLSAIETLHLNSYNTLPLLLLTCTLSGEFSEAIHNFHYHNIPFVAVLMLVIFMGCGLNYMLFLCTTYNCALTTSITGTLKSIVQTAIGMFTFGGISINIYTLAGICLNLTGGIAYSFAKWRESQSKLMYKCRSQNTLSDAEIGHLKSHAYTNGSVVSKAETETVTNRNPSECSQEHTATS